MVSVISCVVAFKGASKTFVKSNTYSELKSMIQLSSTKEKDVAAEKLIYDTKTGRFYERNIEEVCEEEFCLVDSDSGKLILLTKEEKERIFLDAIQSYYFKGQSGLPDEQFDQLKEDLSWEGSVLVSLNRDETLFMNAIQAYTKGKPIISDKEFDQLKLKLKENQSKIAVQSEPKCYVDTGVCKVTWAPDTVRTSSLYIPATLLITTAYIGGLYELLSTVGINLNPILALLVGAVPIRTMATALTENVFFNSPAVATGACPSCGAENRIFFGGVLGVMVSHIRCEN